MKKQISMGLFLLIGYAPIVRAQEAEDEFFHEIEVARTYINNERWRGAAAANWKYIYDEIGWRRWGGDAYISRKIRFMSLEGGLTANYTFDKDIVNYLEVRPWLALRTDFEMGRRIALMQKLKVENRHFFYGNTYPAEQRIRTRFLLSLKYDFLRDREDWKLNPFGEWYFVGKAADAERFSNSLELGFKLIRVLCNENEIALGYKRESFKSAFISKSKQGYTITLEYTF